MGFFFGRRIHKAILGDDVVDVSEQDGVRSLHLGTRTVQSAMRLNAPNGLELAYTRGMMSALLFNPEPARFLVIGLGGGSLSKFIYHQLPTAHTTSVEINPQVVAAARAYFHLPPEDARFAIEISDGGQYVAAHPGTADVLIVDGFDGVSLADSLVSQCFYDDCAAALDEQGILAVNLWGSDKNFELYQSRIETSFEGRTLCLPTEKRGNIVVFGFKKSLGDPRWADLRERAQILEQRHGLEFSVFVENLRHLNAHTKMRLLG